MAARWGLALKGSGEPTCLWSITGSELKIGRDHAVGPVTFTTGQGQVTDKHYRHRHIQDPQRPLRSKDLSDDSPLILSDSETHYVNSTQQRNTQK